jgi:serine/threonine-protein kinase
MSGDLTPNDWQELEALIDQVLDSPPERRAALMAELSGGNEARRAELERLVAECEQAYPLLDRPVAERFATLLDDHVTRVPDVLADRYRVVRELGRGGMAVVYLARDMKHERDVAVKIVRPEVAASLGRQRFLREIAIAAKLKHPHIVPLFDSGEVENLLYYVMPYEEGDSLRARLTREGRLSVSDAVSILTDVCDALAYAHQHGVVHRDIKPENVLLSGRHAMVADFGIARAFTAASESTTLITGGGALLGTPAYMAPEQAAVSVPVDHRVDIYAVGVMAYEMLAGQRPFSGATPPSQRMTHSEQAAIDLSGLRQDVPTPLSALVSKCLATRAADRYQSADEVMAALDLITSPDFVVERDRRSLSAPSAQVGWRTRTTRWAIIIVVIAGAVVATRALSNRTRTQAATGVPSAPRLIIGVLPIRPTSPSGELDWLSRDVAHELWRVLSEVPGLEVLPNETIAALVDRGMPLDSIALGRGVDYFVKAPALRGGPDSVLVSPDLIEGGIRSVRGPNVRESLRTSYLAPTIARYVADSVRIVLGRHIRERQLEATPTNALAQEQRRHADRYRLQARARLGENDTLGARLALDSAEFHLLQSQHHDKRWAAPRLTRAALSATRALLLMKPRGTDYARVRATFDAGIAIVDSVLKDTPRNALALALRGSLRRDRIQLGNVGPQDAKVAFDAAQRDLQSALEIDSLLPAPAADLSGIMFTRGKFREAADHAERAYRLDRYLENASEIIDLLARSKLEIEQDTSAANWCAEGLRRFPHEPTHYGCALEVIAWGNDVTAQPNVALRYLKELARIQEYDVGAIAVYTSVFAAVLARSQAATKDSARAALRRAYDLASGLDSTATSYSDFLASAAAVHYRLGETARADSLVRQLRRRDSDGVELRLRRRALRDHVRTDPSTR